MKNCWGTFSKQLGNIDISHFLFKGLRPPAADPQQNEGMMLRGYENHEAIALVTCAS